MTACIPEGPQIAFRSHRTSSEQFVVPFRFSCRHDGAASLVREIAGYLLNSLIQ